MNGADWYALTTAPQQEHQVKDRLTRASVNVLLPTEDVERRAGFKRVVVSRLKLPGYVFVSGCDPWDIRRTFRDRGVARVLCRDGVPGAIPHDRMTRWIMQDAAPLIHSRAIVAGRKAEIVKGPGLGHTVEVAAVNGPESEILMWLLGAKRRVKIQTAFLVAA